MVVPSKRKKSKYRRKPLDYLHFIQFPIHLSFTHIYHFNMLSLTVWQDTFHTYKNPIYDLAHCESHIGQRLERPTSIWKVMGSTPVGASVNSFSEYRGYFNLRTLIHYYFTLYPNQQSIYHLFTLIISTCWAIQYGKTHVQGVH